MCLKILKDALVEIRGPLWEDGLDDRLQVKDPRGLGRVKLSPYTYEIQNHLLLGRVHAVNQLLWLFPHLFQRSRALPFVTFPLSNFAICGDTIKV